MEQTASASRPRRRRKVYRKEWSDIELIYCFLVCFITLIMTVARISTAVEPSVQEEAPSENQYVVIGETAQEQSAQKEADSENTGDVSDTSYGDLSQYASASGYAGMIYRQLDQYPEASYVLRNLDMIPEDILQFVERFPESMPFAAAYPDFQRAGIRTEIDLTAEAVMDTVPLLIQWDPRWGYETYGSGFLGCTGCGPTCLSMVSLYLSGLHDNDPYSIARYADENGYYSKGSGSSWTLMSKGSKAFGITPKELPLDENRMISELEKDHPIILALGPGDFTDNGHYIVLSGYKDGAFQVCDPNSPKNSAKLWTYDQLKGQIKNIWSFQETVIE